MQIGVRAHDLGVRGIEQIISGLYDVGADGGQLVCYKSFEDIHKKPAGITQQQASAIGQAFRKADLSLQLIGAYFNPVHSDPVEMEKGIGIFCDYLRMSGSLGCRVVGSETGSYQDEPWIYHPKNRTREALERVVEVFRKLCDHAADYGAEVGIEGASRHVCYDVETLDLATQLIGRSNLKIIFDLFNFMDDSHFRDYLKILERGLTAFAGRIHCFHIKDCLFTEDGLKQCAVGKGDLDFDSILAMIKSYDPHAVLILEGTMSGNLKESIAFIRDKWQKA